jgi:surface antigen
MFRFPQPHPRGPSARRSALLAALTAALLAGCSTLGSPTPGITPAPDGKAPPTVDGNPRPPTLLVRSLGGSAAATEIARQLDSADLKKLMQTLELTRNHSPVYWRNEATAREFILSPQGGFGGGHGPCREFSIDVTTGGQTDRLRGTACQQIDAMWKLMR